MEMGGSKKRKLEEVTLPPNATKEKPVEMMEDRKEITVYVVAQFQCGHHCGAIYGIQIGADGQISGRANEELQPVAKIFPSDVDRVFTSVTCAQLGLDLYLVASYLPYDPEMTNNSLLQLPCYVFNMRSGELSETLHMPAPSKPFPVTFSLLGKIHVIPHPAGARVDIDPPAVGCFDPTTQSWGPSSIPDFPWMPERQNFAVHGYAVLDDNCIVVSGAPLGHDDDGRNRSFFYRVGSLHGWREIIPRGERSWEFGLMGRCEYVDGVIYMGHQKLSALPIIVSEDGDISFGEQVLFSDVGFVDPPDGFFYRYSCCISHLGNKRFSMIRSAISNLDAPFISITVVQVGEKLGSAEILDATIRPFNMSGLQLPFLHSSFALFEE